MFAFLKALKRSDAKPFLARIEAGDMILIDLREENELAATGSAQGALHLPLDDWRKPLTQRTAHATKRLALKGR